MKHKDLYTLLAIWTLILLACFVSIKAHANPIKELDLYATEHLAWENTQLADTISDVGLVTMALAPTVVAWHTNQTEKLPTLVLVQLANHTLTDTVKQASQRTRPNGEDNLSFYSGHSSSSFVSAGLVCTLTDGPVCASSLLLASTTAILRVMARKHWLSDILVGASVGYSMGTWYPTIMVRW